MIAQSDDFNTTILGSHWTVVDPVGDGAVSVNGAQLVIDVPAGTAHDVWVSGNDSVRVTQAHDDVDFEMEAKFDSVLGSRFQLQGFLVEQDAGNFLRFDSYHDGTALNLFAASFVNGSPSVEGSIVITNAQPLYIRVNRTGNVWTQYYSSNGVDWVAATSFTFAITVNNVSIFAGNAGASPPPPAFQLLVDDFVMTAGGVVTQVTGVSIESYGLVAHVDAPHVESISGLSVVAGLELESLSSVIIDNSVPIETLRGVQAAYQAHVENLAQLAVVRVQQLESLIITSRAQSINGESLQSINRTAQVATESQQPITQVIRALFEFLSTSSIAAAQRLTLENKQLASILSTQAIEANSAIAQVQRNGFECLSALLTISRHHLEQLQTAQHATRLHYETTGAAAISTLLVMPIEQRSYSAQSVSAAIEVNQQVTSTMQSHAESLQLVNAPLSLEFEQFAYLQTTVQGNIEAIAYVQLNTPLDLESLSVITATVDLNIEVLRVISTAAGIPIEALQGATANVIIDVIERTAYFTFEIEKIITIH